METIHVLNGAFMDILLQPFFQVYDEPNRVIRYWGDGRERFDATTIEDAARFTAAAALDASLQPGKFAIAGQQLSFGDVARDLEQATGVAVRPESLGTAADLQNWITKTRRDTQDVMAIVPALYQLYMITGRTALSDHQNGRYATVRPETFSEYLQRSRQSLAGGSAA